MKRIINHEALQLLSKGEAVIIDVRENAEFREHHLPGAINLPSTNFNTSHFEGFKESKICLICQSGKRAEQVAKKLFANGFAEVFLLETQMAFISEPSLAKGWTIDRQFRLTLGILIALSMLLFPFIGIYALILPAILATGLIFTAIIDQCYLRMLIAKMPWNRNKSN